MTHSLGHCTLDLDARAVRWPDRTEELTPIEAKLLGYLIQHAGRAVPRAEVLTEVWGYHPDSKTHTVGVIVRRVRKKIERAPGQPLVLRTVRGTGWQVTLPSGPSVDVRHNVVAPRERLIGRVDVLARLHDARLVTLTGPPGVGKTRLALEHAQRCTRDGRHGEVWFVRLGGVTSRDDVAARVADTLGVVLKKEGGWVEHVGRALAGRGPVLLVLDEAEAVAREVAEVVDHWLDAAPHAQLCITSRQRLRVRGERVVRLAPLGTEEGAELFVGRASDRAAVDADDPSIAAIVEHLQGLPLAIELAAARIDLRSPATILAELQDHTSEPLEAAVRWTVELLAPWERRALAQASVFAGGFDLEAARTVLELGPDHSAEGAVMALVDWSLLRRHAPSRPGSPVRFDSLTFIAEHAATLLDDPAPVVQRHARAYGRFGTGEVQRALHRHGGLALRARLADDRANLALGARRGEAEDAARCARALSSLTNVVGPVTDGIAALEAVLARDDLSGPLRYRTLLALARACVRASRHGDAAATLEQADALRDREPSSFWRAQHAFVAFGLSRRAGSGDPVGIGRQALELAQASGDLKEVSVAEMNLANALMDVGEVDEARALQQASLGHAAEVGDERGEVYAKALIAMWAYQWGEEDALDQLLEARARAEAIGDRHTVTWLVTSVITALGAAGRYEEAIEAAEDGIRVAADIGDQGMEAVCRGNLATVLRKMGEPGEAVELLEETLRGIRRTGWPAAEAAFLCELAEARTRSGGDGTDDVLAAIALLEELGSPTELAKGWVQRGTIAALLGDIDTARAALATSHDVAGDRTTAPLDEARRALQRRL